MKIKGKKIEGVNIEICPIPRGEEYIIFKCGPVNLDDFDKLCPPPKPMVKILKGGEKVEDVESPKYKAEFVQYSENRINYMILKSLQATEDLTWDTIDMSDSTTWKNFESEMKDSGFSTIEISRIINTVMSANCLDERKLEKARADFLAGRLQESEILPFPTEGQ